jgi:hypothetical protein
LNLCSVYFYFGFFFLWQFLFFYFFASSAKPTFSEHTTSFWTSSTSWTITFFSWRTIFKPKLILSTKRTLQLCKAIPLSFSKEQTVQLIPLLL